MAASDNPNGYVADYSARSALSFSSFQTSQTQLGGSSPRAAQPSVAASTPSEAAPSSTEPNAGVRPSGIQNAEQKTVDWANPRVSAILSAAAKCFAQTGFSTTTLADIGKELGLRKSIVHYYFASKTALIHEVQSYSYQNHLSELRQSLSQQGPESPSLGAPGEAQAAAENTEPSTATQGQRASRVLSSLWNTIKQNPSRLWLDIEVWAAARRDEEIKQRAAEAHREGRAIIAGELASALSLSSADTSRLEPASTLAQAVVNGLHVAQYLEGDSAQVDEAYELFLLLLKSGLKHVEDVGSSDQA